MNSLLSTLVYILAFTLVIEGIGMLAIWGDIHGTMGMDLQEELALFTDKVCNLEFKGGKKALVGADEPVVHVHGSFIVHTLEAQIAVSYTPLERSQ